MRLEVEGVAAVAVAEAAAAVAAVVAAVAVAAECLHRVDGDGDQRWRLQMHQALGRGQSPSLRRWR